MSGEQVSEEAQERRREVEEALRRVRRLRLALGFVASLALSLSLAEVGYYVMLIVHAPPLLATGVASGISLGMSAFLCQAWFRMIE